jgi:hypothetical protein
MQVGAVALEHRMRLQRDAAAVQVRPDVGYVAFDRHVVRGEAMQRALAAELDAAHAPDGYVFEELAEIASSRGDRAAARTWAARALALLRDDAELRANEPARLAHLADLARNGEAAGAGH